jgi:bifunctional ADP-heptose synthase (sugar kinase/adenylyltransferase)
MKILVIGESCLDVFHYGECKRLCPEAPVPVFNSTRTVDNGGMAMNVYNNLKSLINNIDIRTNDNWREIKKTRFVDEKANHMFMRLDENDQEYGKFEINQVDFTSYDAVVVSDYNKGYLSEQDLSDISKRHPKTFLDTKKVLGEWCKEFSFIKINGIEYDKTKHLIDDEIRKIMIVTQGSKGCFYQETCYNVPLVEVKDVSGAGDTFLASFSYKYLLTENVDKSIDFANQCATQVVQKRGVSTI